MKYLFEISKEHETLPTDEIISVVNTIDNSYKIFIKNDDVLIIDTDISMEQIIKISQRLSFTYSISIFLFKSDHDTNHIRYNALKNPIINNGSIAVKYRNRSISRESKPVIKEIADVYTQNKKVSLQKPDVEIRVIISENDVYVGELITSISRTQFEERKAQHRPYFSPISLHPKIARALVNLSGIKNNQTIFDPFCGTGGILIEAGLIGCRVIGSDISDKMIEGTKQNLQFYNITNYDIFVSDVGDVKKTILKKVDSVVTDFPYGKSTTTKGEEILELYERAFKSISEIIKTNGIAVIGIPNEELIPLSKQYFSLIKIYKIPVHRSLTRYFIVLRG
jgi:tRNA (guanine10-N2)-dimethyltransferase